MMERAGVDRLAALHPAIDIVRRGGTISLSRRLRRHGRPAADADAVRQADAAADGAGERQALGRRHHAAARRRRPARAWRASRPTTCRSPTAPEAYEKFQKKEDGYVKVLLQP